MKRGGRVGHRLDHAHVGAEHVLQEILAVPGERERAHVGVAGLAHLAEQRLRVLDRVALAERVAGEQELTIVIEHDRLRGGRAEVAAEQHRAHVARARRVTGSAGGGFHVLGHERGEIAGAGDQTAGAVLGLLLVLPRLDPPRELLASLIDRDLGLFGAADLDAPQARVVERLGRHHDE
jgi:hypothetical protein